MAQAVWSRGRGVRRLLRGLGMGQGEQQWWEAVGSASRCRLLVGAPVLPDRTHVGLKSERSRGCVLLGLSGWKCAVAT